MSAPPKTVVTATPEEEAAIRAAVREARGLDPSRRIAALEDAAALAEFFSDPRVSDPIYSLPRPFTVENVRAWIAERSAKHACGECILSLAFDADGRVGGYTEIDIWPERASGEIAGAVRADRQNSRQGGAGMERTIDWMFETLGIRLMCLTAALDNPRSQKIIDAAGFVRMGGRDGVRPDGATRPSVYWEMTRDQWRARKRAG